jgi:hypothetical protein
MSVGVTPGLIKALKIEDAAGVGQYFAVVQGANDGGCKKPTGANVAGFLGITHVSQPNQNKAVSVTLDGIERATVSGAVARGDRLNIAGATGKLQSCEAAITAAPSGAAANYNVVGEAMAAATTDGDIIPVRIRPFLVKVAAS